MDYLEINRTAWDQRTQTHIKSDFYDVEGFLAGKNSLNPIELDQLGDVQGQRLLHLQCHFGLDTLSWARRGAEVTGVDLSPEAIKQAGNLAEKTGLPAKFVESDVYDLEHRSELGLFDVVFSSYGALCWLPDLNRWAKVVNQFLKPGGSLHLVEFHPCIELFLGGSYFSLGPEVLEEESYTENAKEKSQMVCWSHSLGEVFEALKKASLQVEIFQEFPHSPYNCFAGLEADAPFGYRLIHQNHVVPMVYAIKAIK